MRILRAAWPVLCAFLCGWSLHDLLVAAGEGPPPGSATSLTRWLVPVVMGLAAIEGVWRGLRTAPRAGTSDGPAASGRPPG